MPVDFKIVKIENVSSTNKYLFDLIGIKDKEEGLVIITDNQTAGKGLGDNHWESQAGKNLTFSILLKPSFLKPEQQFVLTQIVSLAILKVCKKELNSEFLKIKWPNDIYAGNKKLAGILVQNIVKGNRISHSIIGIGLNVNQEDFVSNAPNPVSMIQLLGKSLRLDLLLTDILNEIEKIYQPLTTETTTWLNNNYTNNLYRIDQSHFFTDKDGRFKGDILGVNNYGQLKIKKPSGQTCIYSYKEIEFELKR